MFLAGSIGSTFLRQQVGVCFLLDAMQKQFSIQNEKYSTIHCLKSVRIRSYSGPHFPAFRLRIQSECGKMRTRIIPYTDTFHAVTFEI